MPRTPRSSGVYLADADRILSNALATVGLQTYAADLIAEAMRRSDVTVLPPAAEALWDLCEASLLPLIEERAGATAREQATAALSGVLGLLDALQHDRDLGFARKRSNKRL